MPPRYHSAHANREFDQLMRRVESWLAQRARANCGFDASVIAARLAQRVVELGFVPFVARRADQERSGNLPPIDSGLRLICGGIAFDSGTGAVSPTRWPAFSGLLNFIVHSTHIILCAVAGLLARHHPGQRPVTIVFGVGAENLFVEGSDTTFVDYCVNGPILPLSEAKWLVVQAHGVAQSSHPKLVSYSRFPLHAIASRDGLGISGVLRLILDSAVTLTRFIRLVRRLPVMATLARDYAYLPLVRQLDGKGRIASIVITNSTFSSQPLWLRPSVYRNFRVHLVWYSQNTVPTVLAADGLKSDLPHYRHLAVDESWVWTEGYAAYLRRLGVTCRYHVVGPILWRLPDLLPPARSNEDIRIAVFDVTPVRDEVALRIGLICNYYRTDNMIRFLEQIHEVSHDIQQMAGKPVRILLKHKRSYNSKHDQKYIDLVARLSAKGQLFELVDHQTPIYRLVADSDVSIVVPYSSPAYVASHMGKPAIFFDPSNQLLDTHEHARNVTFAAAKQQLFDQITHLVLHTRAL